MKVIIQFLEILILLTAFIYVVKQILKSDKHGRKNSN